jgi:hypothetical protein
MSAGRHQDDQQRHILDRRCRLEDEWTGKKGNGTAESGQVPFDSHAHVLGHVWTERLVETDADQAIRMTSEIDDLPLLPVLAPQSDAPSSSGPGFRAVLIPKRRHPGLGHLVRDGRRVFVRTAESAGSLEREERPTEVGPTSLDGGVRGRHEGGAVHGVLSGCGRHRGEDRSAEKERAIGVARHGCKR